MRLCISCRFSCLLINIVTLLSTHRSYTSVTKILFLCLWYCAIYPAAFFMCSFTLLVNYFSDRFALMRTWKRAPQLGTTISKVSRRYFFSLACVAMAVISSYYWSAFPFDNLCANDNAVNSTYIGKFEVKPLGHHLQAAPNFSEVTSKSTEYRYCLQDLMTPGHGNTFPFIPNQQPPGEEWMTESQEDITVIYGWSSVGVTAVVVISFLYGWIQLWKGLFKSSYEVSCFAIF